MAVDKTHAGYLDLDAETIEENTDLVQQILGSCLVLTATCNPLTGLTRYLLISEEFEVIGENDPIPEYTINVDTDEQGDPTSVTFVKVA